jgi:hypothetical protein
MYATAVGLVKFGMGRGRVEESRFKTKNEETLYHRVKSRMGEWIGQIF